MALTILEGSTFCVCDELGDLDEPTDGALRERHALPLALGADRQRRAAAAALLRRRSSTSRPRSSCATRSPADSARTSSRSRASASSATACRITWSSATTRRRRLEFELALEIGTDFADIFAVKDWDFALGDPENADRCRDAGAACVRPGRDVGHARRPERQLPAASRSSSSPRRGEIDGSTMRYRLALDPRRAWRLRVDVTARPTVQRRDRHRRRAPLRRTSSSACGSRSRPGGCSVPQLRASWDDLHTTFDRSVADLASLRMHESGAARSALRRPACRGSWPCSAATRSSRASRRCSSAPSWRTTRCTTLAELQATEDDPFADAEPGKIVHEVRNGKARRRLVPALLRHGRRDAALPRAPLGGVALDRRRRARPQPARAGHARARMDRRVRRSRRRRLRRVPAPVGARAREPVVEGLRTTRSSSHDGRLATGADRGLRGAGLRLRREAAHGRAGARGLARPRARRPARARGGRAARPLRRGVLDRGARRLLRARARRGEATGSTRSRSNIGHLLWSGIVPTERVDAVVDRAHGRGALVGLGRADDVVGRRRLQPARVPQRNRLAARQFAHRARPRAGRPLARGAPDRAAARSNAAAYFDHQLPEVFAGFSRTETPFPIAVSDRGRPQAWAAATPVLLLQVLLGLEPDRRAPGARDGRAAGVAFAGRARSDSPACAPSTEVWDVVLADGHVRVEETEAPELE